MTIRIDEQLEQLLRRQAAAEGYASVQGYLRDRLAAAGVCQENELGVIEFDEAVDDNLMEKAGQVEDGLTRGERIVEQLTGKATRKITFDQIAAYTRGDE
ncbi:MAG: hypothetical protein AAF916_08885 [Planctomycetota bacterium]